MPRTKTQKKRGVGKGDRTKLSYADIRAAELALQEVEHLYAHGVAFDTETTGLGKWCEIWEIAAYDIATGQLLISTLVHPSQYATWEPTAFDMMIAGGITRSMLEGAPPWEEVEEAFRRKLDGRLLVAWSADAKGQEPFDRRLMSQSRRARGYPMLTDGNMTVTNVKPLHRAIRKREYEQIRKFVPATIRGLSRAARVEGLAFSGKEHRAQADAEMVTKIVRKLVTPVIFD